MKNKQKETGSKQQLEVLNKRIKELEQVNDLLAKENHSLKERIKNQQTDIGELSKIKDAWHNEISEIKKLRIEYKKLIEDVLAERKKFLDATSR